MSFDGIDDTTVNNGAPLYTQSCVYKNRTVLDTDQFNGVMVGKLDGKVAVITGGSTGMALAGLELVADGGATAI